MCIAFVASLVCPITISNLARSISSIRLNHVNEYDLRQWISIWIHAILQSAVFDRPNDLQFVVCANQALNSLFVVASHRSSELAFKTFWRLEIIFSDWSLLKQCEAGYGILNLEIMTTYGRWTMFEEAMEGVQVSK